MKNFSQELRDQLQNLPFKITIIDDEVSQNYLITILTEQFKWSGSKIDWSTTVGHQYCKVNFCQSDFYDQIKLFINYPEIKKAVQTNQEIYYVNDGTLDLSICLDGINICEFIQYITDNIPLHHYFLDLTGEWCLAVTSEGYIDFGFSA